MPGLTGLPGLSGLNSGYGGPYHEKILDYNPIVLFPLWEAAGVQADEIANGWNGVHTGVTLGQPGLGDRYTCPWYDGLNDFTNVFTVNLQGAFNGNEGTVLIWAKVHNVGVWTDGNTRYLINLRVNGQNQVYIRRHGPTNNRLEFMYEAGNIEEKRNVEGLATTDWFCAGMTWSKSTGPTGEVRAFIGGVQQGATRETLGVWVGNLFATDTAIGAYDTTPINAWHGWLEYGAVLDYPLPPGAMAELGILVGGVL